MILQFIVLVSVCQLMAYLIGQKFKVNYSKSIILTAVLIGYFFIFPSFFRPEFEPNQIRCGMPMFGIMMGFWMFGTLFALITPILFYSFSKVAEMKKQVKGDEYV